MKISFRKNFVFTAAFSIAVACFNLPAQARNINTPEPFIQIVDTEQFPQIVKSSNASLIRQSFSLSIPQTSSQVSEVIVTIPSGLNVGKDIKVSDNSNKNIKSNISVNAKKIVIDFPEPVSSGTTLNVSLNEVRVSGVSNSWDYFVSAKFIGTNKAIPVGVAQFGVY